MKTVARPPGAKGMGAIVTVVLAATLTTMTGCTVGDGTGALTGPIFFLGCGTKGEDYGTVEIPKTFALDPHFFAGEPIEDIAVANKTNRLLIRVQRTGNRIEVNDTLYVDVLDAFEVARCVRGRTVGGVPDYLTHTTTDSITGVPTATPWCDWSGAGTAGDAGGMDDAGDSSDAGDAGDAGTDAGIGAPVGTHARIHLGTEELVRSSLSLLFTCHLAAVTGMAFDGWIDFKDFGGAAQPDRPSEQRDEIGPDFKVNFGDRLQARLEIVLGDQRIIGAVKGLRPLPDPLIGGTLDGNFDFDLERGRAAQPFP